MPGPPAQSKAKAPPGLFGPPLQSPEVHPDRNVTFRLYAPQASSIKLVGEVLQGRPPMPMTKDGDGVWNITIGPLPPEIWI